MSRLINLDDDRNHYIGMDDEYEQWNIDPNVIAEAQPNLQPTCNNVATDCISRAAAIDAVNRHFGFSVEEEYGSAVQEVINGLPSAKPLTEIDYTELRHRFGETVERVVRDMITGKGERWNG